MLLLSCLWTLCVCLTIWCWLSSRWAFDTKLRNDSACPNSWTGFAPNSKENWQMLSSGLFLLGFQNTFVTGWIWVIRNIWTIMSNGTLIINYFFEESAYFLNNRTIFIQFSFYLLIAKKDTVGSTKVYIFFYSFCLFKKQNYEIKKYELQNY